MTTSFGQYSRYYDLLYADKDYAGEVAYIRTLIETYSKRSVSSLLELGCGTGIHAGMLAKQGIDVTGVDMSEEMLVRARERSVKEGIDNGRISFLQGDARTFRAGHRFDIVTSLFHVLSYQISEGDLNAVIATAATHLDTDGLFVFDFWYGPAVLWQRPSVRVKRLSDDHISVTRLADPVIHDIENVVDVNYTVFVEECGTATVHEIKETHRMRFLFLPEIDRLLSGHGFVRMQAEEWLTRKAPSLDSWGVCVVAQRR